MSDNCEHIDSILERSGRDQLQRFNEVLDPDSLKLHDFEIEDWMLFAYNFAKHVNFFDPKKGGASTGNWQEFFKYFDYAKDTVPLRGHPDYEDLKAEISKTLEEEGTESNVTPHFTLFICFLKLIQFSQDRFNKLTKRHLDFYFEKILQVEKLPATEDKVHLLFEIAKKSASENILKDTKLDGDKDKDGKKRIYKTDTDLIANKTKVALLKNIYHHQEFEVDDTDPVNIIETIVDAEINAADVANSFDGKGEDFPDASDYWWPFGYSSGEDTFDDLDPAKVGFSVASPLLNLKEGDRTITVTMTFNEVLNTFPLEELKTVFKIYGSGEEEWISSFEWDDASSMSNTTLVLKFRLAIDQPAIVNYNSEVLEGHYNTDYPVLKFLIATNKSVSDLTKPSAGYSIYRELALKTLNSITIKVDVIGISSLELENDTGIINSKKPFYPFTTNPIKKSNFIINYPEIFSKSWTSLGVDMIWKDTPEFKKKLEEGETTGFVKHYENYKDESKTPTGTPPATPPAIVTSDDYFEFVPGILRSDGWEEGEIEGKIVKKELFTQQELDDKTQGYKTIHIFANPIEGTGSVQYKPDSSGPVRLSITKSFLQELFPTKYALAISAVINGSGGKPSDIPKEPYIPLVEEIQLNYSAQGATDNVISSEISLFHEAPFGQHQITITPNETNLIPQHCKGGSLFIGIEGAEPNQQISLLIQVLEGSENPLETPFVGKQRVEWDVLVDNQWITLEESILLNSTDNLLKSGIIRFALPKDVTTNNTRLPSRYTWIRARIHKNYDAVSKIKGIYAQAVVATFDNQDNELSHLEQGLEAETISKLITRVPQIKGITQPFNSFDGRPQESDAAYYRRISERLRHKNRAITLWDYENLVLQEFPEIYKVKCLNHTSDSSFLSPGDVTLVVIPDTINKNVFDIFQPRVSKATINKVQNYINKLNTMLVTARVTNPLYEGVKVNLKAKFYDQYDVDFYQKQLKEDITKFLSPWAFDVSRTVDFGVVLYRSVLIDYLEKLYYVDYLEEVKLIKVAQNGEEILPEEGIETISISPSTPAAILVSAKSHEVDTAVEPCEPINIAPREECQI